MSILCPSPSICCCLALILVSIHSKQVGWTNLVTWRVAKDTWIHNLKFKYPDFHLFVEDVWRSRLTGSHVKRCLQCFFFPAITENWRTQNSHSQWMKELGRFNTSPDQNECSIPRKSKSTKLCPLVGKESLKNGSSYCLVVLDIQGVSVTKALQCNISAYLMAHWIANNSNTAFGCPEQRQVLSIAGYRGLYYPVMQCL